MTMTPLEAAQALVAMDPALMYFEQCGHCGEKQRDHGGVAYEIVHKPDCPWLAMPQIVAALEAAQAVIVSCLGRHDYGGESFRVDEVAINDLRAALLPPATPERRCTTLRGIVYPDT